MNCETSWQNALCLSVLKTSRIFACQRRITANVDLVWTKSRSQFKAPLPVPKSLSNLSTLIPNACQMHICRIYIYVHKYIYKCDKSTYNVHVNLRSFYDSASGDYVLNGCATVTSIEKSEAGANPPGGLSHERTTTVAMSVVD